MAGQGEVGAWVGLVHRFFFSVLLLYSFILCFVLLGLMKLFELLEPCWPHVCFLFPKAMILVPFAGRSWISVHMFFFHVQ